MSDAALKAKLYLQDYFKVNCDVMPNPTGNSALLHLPANTTREMVYKKYRDYCAEKGLVEVSDGALSRLWNTHFKHVKIPAKGRFKECDAYVDTAILLSCVFEVLR